VAAPTLQQSAWSECPCPGSALRPHHSGRSVCPAVLCWAEAWQDGRALAAQAGSWSGSRAAGGCRFRSTQPQPPLAAGPGQPFVGRAVPVPSVPPTQPHTHTHTTTTMAPSPLNPSHTST
jgi:hypothetical protein